MCVYIYISNLYFVGSYIYIYIIMAKSKISIAGRLLGFISTLVAAVVMAADKQSIEGVGQIFTIRFTDWNTFT